MQKPINRAWATFHGPILCPKRLLHYLSPIFIVVDIIFTLLEAILIPFFFFCSSKGKKETAPCIMTELVPSSRLDFIELKE